MDEMRKRLGQLSPEQRELLRKRLASDRSASLIRPQPRSATSPLSWSQEHLWEIHQRHPGMTAYTIALRIALRGTLDVTTLGTCFTELLRRHETLRTGFVLEAGVPVQHVAPEADFPLPMIDLSDLPINQRAMEQALLEQAEARRPFDLARPPLMRATVLRLDSDQHMLLLCLHHIIADGWSVGVLLRELLQLYAQGGDAAQAALLPLPIQYADYAIWQRHEITSPMLQQVLEWWHQQLADLPPLLHLPAAHADPSASPESGNLYYDSLPETLVEDIKQCSERGGVTSFMLMLAALYVLLADLTNQDDMLIGSPIASRRHPETEPLVGLFVNLLPLRLNLTGIHEPSDVLARVREICLQAYEHQEAPYLLLARQSHLADPDAPLFNVVFNVQNTPRSADVLEDLLITSTELGNGGARYDLTWSIVPDTANDTWHVVIEYRRARVGRADVADWYIRWVEALTRFTRPLR